MTKPKPIFKKCWERTDTPYNSTHFKYTVQEFLVYFFTRSFPFLCVELLLMRNHRGLQNAITGASPRRAQGAHLHKHDFPREVLAWCERSEAFRPTLGMTRDGMTDKPPNSHLHAAPTCTLSSSGPRTQQGLTACAPSSAWNSREMSSRCWFSGQFPTIQGRKGL